MRSTLPSSVHTTSRPCGSRLSTKRALAPGVGLNLILLAVLALADAALPADWRDLRPALYMLIAGGSAAVAYTGIARRMVQGLKFHDRTDLAPWMARWMLRAGAELIADAEVVVHVAGDATLNEVSRQPFYRAHVEIDIDQLEKLQRAIGASVTPAGVESRARAAGPRWRKRAGA